MFAFVFAVAAREIWKCDGIGEVRGVSEYELWAIFLIYTLKKYFFIISIIIITLLVVVSL